MAVMKNFHNGHKPPVEDLPDSCHSNGLSVLSLHIRTGRSVE